MGECIRVPKQAAPVSMKEAPSCADQARPPFFKGPDMAIGP